MKHFGIIHCSANLLIVSNKEYSQVGTFLGREFDWDSMPAKVQRRRPKTSIIVDGNHQLKIRLKACLIICISGVGNRESVV